MLSREEVKKANRKIAPNNGVLTNLCPRGAATGRQTPGVGWSNDLWRGMKSCEKGAPKAEQAIAEKEAVPAKGAP